ncbi:MAG: DEAD/DEAH box helicase [archaeon]
MEFNEFKLSKNILLAIKRMGLETPTKIQEISIPHILEGKDVIGQSATGSGKTLAFGCAIVERVVPNKGIQALVLTPTRELCLQVTEALKQISQNSLKIISVYGGVSINDQIYALTHADVVVATPGRMLDHLGRETVDTSGVKVLVLDEADRMLEMGFIEDVEQIVQTCPRDRQTLFFSATISDQIRDLTDQYMSDPIRVTAEPQVDPSKLKQVYYDVEKNMKISLLVHLLKHEKARLAMVFCNTRRNTDFIGRALKANGISAIPIHGGLSQNKRTKTMEMFNDAKVGVLVCTDVAARGLHIENVSHIYNYDIPKDSKDYVHRIGRTARAGDEGIAVNLLCDYDYDNFSRIVEDYHEFKIQKMERPYIEKIEVADRGGFSRGDRRPGGPRRFSGARGTGGSGRSEGPRGSGGPRRYGSSRGSDGPRSGSPRGFGESRGGPRRFGGSRGSGGPRRTGGPGRSSRGPGETFGQRREPQRRRPQFGNG